MNVLVKEELRRLFELLPKTDPRSDEYTVLLRNLELLGLGSAAELHEAMLDAWSDDPNAAKPFEVLPGKTAADIPAAPVAATTPAEVATEEKVEEATPKAEPDYAALGLEIEDGNLTKASVRAYLARAKTERNMDITALLDTLGCAKLSEVPEDKYFDLIRLAEKGRT